VKQTIRGSLNKLLFLCSVILLFSLANQSVQAGGSPSILIEPELISPYGNVIITVRAVVPDTIIANQNPIKVQRAIVINNPVKLFGRVFEDYYLQLTTDLPPWGPIILPDAGDGLIFSFPDATVEVIDVGDENVEIPDGTRGWFTAAEDPRYPLRFAPRDRLMRGTYILVISGLEGGVYFHTFTFFAVGS
jgi:hypothetical protein